MSLLDDYEGWKGEASTARFGGATFEIDGVTIDEGSVTDFSSSDDESSVDGVDDGVDAECEEESVENNGSITTSNFSDSFTGDSVISLSSRVTCDDDPVREDKLLSDFFVDDDDKESVMSEGGASDTLSVSANERLPSNCIKMQRSLFVGVEPTIFFQYADHVEEKRKDDKNTFVKDQAHKVLYKGGDVNCLRSAFKMNGFTKLISGGSWNVFWGKHLRPEKLMELTPYQKVNHFPSSWQLGRKDMLSRNMMSMQRKFGKEFKFFAKTFNLPTDFASLKTELDAHPKSIWIIKPSASACGRGIRLITAAALKEKSSLKNVVAQKYIHRPLLIDGHKFDLRIYVLVTSFDPLRIYIYDNGLVRFCTAKYSIKPKNLKNRFSHLTNYSVNRKARDYVSNQNVNDDGEGHKWSLHALEDYCKTKGINFDEIMVSIKDKVIKCIISAEDPISSNTNRSTAQKGNIFELFGFDILLDRKLKPWVIEVNVSPSLSSSAPLDKKIKNMLMNDIYHVVGVQEVNIASARKMQVNKQRPYLKPTRPLSGKSRVLDFTTTNGLTSANRDQRDLLCTLEDEYARSLSTHFIRIFPGPETKEKYGKYFVTTRHNNALYDQWFRTSNEMKRKILLYRSPEKEEEREGMGIVHNPVKPIAKKSRFAKLKMLPPSSPITKEKDPKEKYTKSMIVNRVHSLRRKNIRVAPDGTDEAVSKQINKLNLVL